MCWGRGRERRANAGCGRNNTGAASSAPTKDVKTGNSYSDAEDAEDFRTRTRMRPSEWNSPPVAVLAVVSGSGGVT